MATKVKLPATAKDINTRNLGSNSTDAFRKRAQKGRTGRKDNPFKYLFQKP